MLAALTVLPALLAVLGPRVNALPRPPLGAPAAPQAADDAVGRGGLVPARAQRDAPAGALRGRRSWSCCSRSARRSCAWPGAGPTRRAAARRPAARVVTEALSRDFPGNPTAPIESVVKFGGPVAGSPARQAALASTSTRLQHVPGVTGAQVTGMRGDIARVDLRYGADPNSSAAARRIVGQVRDTRAARRRHGPTCGGQSAQLVDELSSLGRTLPWMALVVALATFVLLFLAFGSVVLPVKAIVMNVLSLSATFGVVVWIFQEGHLSGLLGFTPDRDHRPDHADPDARDHVRAVHGLRGVPAVPDPRALRPHRRQHRRRGQRAAAHRRADHERGAAADHRDRRVLRVRASRSSS